MKLLLLLHCLLSVALAFSDSALFASGRDECRGADNSTEPFRDDGFWYKCAPTEGLPLKAEIVFCNSNVADETRLPVGGVKERPTKNGGKSIETCKKGSLKQDLNRVYYKSGFTPSHDQIKTNHLCAKHKEETFFDDESDGFLKQCRFYDNCHECQHRNAKLDTIGCSRFTPVHIENTPKPTEQHLNFGEYANATTDGVKGGEVKCVNEGSKEEPIVTFLTGAVRLCENHAGETVNDNWVLKKCSRVNETFYAEVVGCVLPNADSSMGAPIHLLINETFPPGGQPIAKCVKTNINGEESAMIIGGDLECENKNRIDADDVYFNCSLNGSRYTKTIEGCRHEAYVGKKQDVPIGSSVFTRNEITLTCVKWGINGAHLVGGYEKECKDKGHNGTFTIGNIEYMCILEINHYRIVPVACLVPAQATVGENVTYSVTQRVPIDEEFITTVQGRHIDLKCLKGDNNTAFVGFGDYQICENQVIGEEFAHGSLYKVCTREDGNSTGIQKFKAKVVGCNSTIDGSKLGFGNVSSSDSVIEFCEKKGNNASLWLNEAARMKKTEAEQRKEWKEICKNALFKKPPPPPTVCPISTESFVVPLSMNTTCTSGDDIYSYNGLVYECDAEDINISEAKPIGCLPLVPISKDDSFLPFDVKREMRKGIYQKCKLPYNVSSASVDFEIDDSVKDGTEILPLPTMCGALRVGNAEVVYDCPRGLADGCYAKIKCKEEPERHHIRTQRDRDNKPSYRTFKCHAERGWVNAFTGARFVADPVDRCVGVGIDGLSNKYFSCSDLPYLHKGRAEYFNTTFYRGKVWNKASNSSAKITCDEGYTLKDQKADFKFYDCVNDTELSGQWVERDTGKSIVDVPIDRCVPKDGTNVSVVITDTFEGLIGEKRGLARACYFNGRQINEKDSAYIGQMWFTCIEGASKKLELQFEGCFSNPDEITGARHIVQCDFSKLDKDAEVRIIRK